MAIEEYWIDGFNLFHRWETTREAFQTPGADMGAVQTRSLRALGKLLGRRAGRIVVFLDGGPHALSTRVGDLRVRWPGPGRSADRMLEEALQGRGAAAATVCAVTDDRELAAGLSYLGATRWTVSEFLAWAERARPAERSPEFERKCRRLSPAEIEGWLDYFGGETPEPR